ncbi:MAG: hypothetical protein CMJ81_21280 [Planctomycetaceae bacterium]|nr:hypothetical protein [Planctomycetaceae bacterium]
MTATFAGQSTLLLSLAEASRFLNRSTHGDTLVIPLACSDLFARQYRRTLPGKPESGPVTHSKRAHKSGGQADPFELE